MGAGKMKRNAKTVSPESNEGRNQYVVNQITQALLQLMEDGPIGNISISQVCTQAQVGRASFYRNFESKEDVIRKHLKALSDQWTKRHENIAQEDLVEALFSHYYEHRALFLLLYHQGLAYMSLENLKESCGPKPEHTNLVAYTTAFISYGIYGWIEEWFFRGLQESPKEMAQLCLEAHQAGMQQISKNSANQPEAFAHV